MAVSDLLATVRHHQVDRVAPRQGTEAMSSVCVLLSLPCASSSRPPTSLSLYHWLYAGPGVCLDPFGPHSWFGLVLLAQKPLPPSPSSELSNAPDTMMVSAHTASNQDGAEGSPVGFPLARMGNGALEAQLWHQTHHIERLARKQDGTVVPTLPGGSVEMEGLSGCLTALLYLGLGQAGVEVWSPRKKHILKDIATKQPVWKPGQPPGHLRLL